MQFRSLAHNGKGLGACKNLKNKYMEPNTIEDIPAIEHAMQSDENAVKRQDAEVSAVKIVSGAADFPPVVTKESGEWTPEDTSFLMENFLEHGPAFCAQHLGRTQKSVSRKADRMQLKRKIG